MKALTIGDVQKHFAAVAEAVIDDAEECVIPLGEGEAVVIVSLDEWNAMKETLHVLGTRTNARRLLDNLDQLDAGLPFGDPRLRRGRRRRRGGPRRSRTPPGR
jgi:antitoxin YefM